MCLHWKGPLLSSEVSKQNCYSSPDGIRIYQLDNAEKEAEMATYNSFEFKDIAHQTTEFKCTVIPVHLSSMQIKQYCSILDSNFQILSSCFRDNSSLQDIIIETQKFANLSEEDASIDSLDVDINVSGKLQLLDKFLSEIKQCGFRVVVLFQPVDNSEKICIGDILDDLVDRRFGQDSYIRIGKICTNSDRQKKKQSLEMFNDVETRKFICLLEYRVCHSSVHLSRMDVAILFNGDWSSSNDIRALQKITIESHSQQLKVFRLYSPFTVEEKVLMILKEGVTMETNITASICHKLLAWGASYLLSKIGSENVSSSFIYDVVHELSSVLRNTSSKTEHTKFSIISKAQINDGTYSSNNKLFGETETGAHTKESWLNEEYLIGNEPSDFWSNLLENRQKNPCYRISRRVQDSPRNMCYLFEGYKPECKEKDMNATIFPDARKKARSKRKRRYYHATRIRDYQSSEMSHTPHQGGVQRDALLFNITPTQPAPHIPVASGSRTNTEIERIQKEREQVMKLHEEKKLMLIANCEKEITEIQKKYDARIRESEMSLRYQLKILDDTLNLHGPDKDTSSIAAPQVPTVRPANLCSTSIRPVNLCSASLLTTRFSGQNIGMRGLRAPAPHLRFIMTLLTRVGDFSVIDTICVMVIYWRPMSDGFGGCLLGSGLISLQWDGSCTKSSDKTISCTNKRRPLALPWGRTPRLTSDVRVSSILGFPSISLMMVVARVGPLSGKDPLVIVVADTDRLPHMCYWLFASSAAICFFHKEKLICDVSLYLLGEMYETWTLLGLSITDIKYVLTQKGLDTFCQTLHIPDDFHPQLPSHNQTIHEMPTGKIDVYTRFFEYANFQLRLSTFLVNVLRYYRVNLSQLSIIAAAKVSHFEILCRVHGIESTVGLFCCFYVNSKNKGCMSFSKYPESDVVCYTKPLYSLKRWNDHFFWVDSFACPASFSWHTDKNVSRDPFLKPTEFRTDDYAVLVAHSARFQKFLEPFLCLIGMSRNYTLDEDTYPTFLHDDGKDMDLLAFIHVVDPTKVKVGEREHAEEEARLLDSTVGRVVLLLPIAPDHADSELEASVEKLFDESGGADQGDSAAGGGQETEAEIVAGVRFVDEENVVAEKPKHPRKKRQAVTDASGSSHPPKKAIERSWNFKWGR
ncbi:protein chromatin remodeling 4 [Tanacetum coccineum]